MLDFEGKGMQESKEIPIEELFKQFDIVILGETYHGTHTDEILSILERSHSLIRGVLIELPVDYQDDVDAYMESGQVTEALESYFKGAEREGKNVRGILKIFDFLKLNEKSITCIDSSKKQTSEYNTRSTHGHYF
jgi:hypothetical protein